MEHYGGKKIRKSSAGVPAVAQQVKNLTSNHKDAGSIPGLIQWVKGSSIAVNYDKGHRCSLDPLLLWLWCRPAAMVLI